MLPLLSPIATSRLPAGLLAACCLMLTVAARAKTTAGTVGFEPFTFIMFGDPQIGYGPGGVYSDTARFELAIDHANAQHAPVVVIPGDLVQSESFWQHWMLARSLSRIEGTLLLTPGNHDVTDEDSLADYRESFGADYHDFVYRDCAFVLVNSETARSPELSKVEYGAQWTWLENTLHGHAAAHRKHIFLITHRPPFVGSEDEPEDGVNWPPAERKRLLDLARRHGVRWILAGHLHRMLTTDTMDAIAVVVLPGSARSFDQSPIGYGRFDVSESSVNFDFVEVASAPSPPPRIPGFNSWTPRLFDFSPGHWFFTLAFGAAGVFALIAARRHRLDKPLERATRLSWLGVAVLMFFYGINMQLDLDEFLRDVGRGVAKLTGLHPLRHVVTGTALGIYLLAATGFLLRHYSRSRKALPTTLALAATLPPTAWFALSTISHHSLGMVFDEIVWDMLSLLAILTVIAASRFVARRSSATKATS